MDAPREWLLTALKRGASVVTANKALLAAHGAELHDAAAESGADLFFEAAVAGAIPVLRALRESLAGDTVRKVMGIVNGTTNVILTRMDENGASFADALAEATDLGYAEADPTADVDGFDAAAKAAILAALAFHVQVDATTVHREGITAITVDDITTADSLGCTIKLLAVAERYDDGSVGVRVHPVMVSRMHPLASVRMAFNAVYVEAEAAGELFFSGQGAGGAPTASAVVGDIVAAARNRVSGSTSRTREAAWVPATVRPMGEITTAGYVALDVADEPGVLAAVSGVFAAHAVSIRTVQQAATPDGARLVVVTHPAPDADLMDTVEALRVHGKVVNVRSVIRVEGE